MAALVVRVGQSCHASGGQSSCIKQKGPYVLSHCHTKRHARPLSFGMTMTQHSEKRGTLATNIKTVPLWNPDSNHTIYFEWPYGQLNSAPRGTVSVFFWVRPKGHFRVTLPNLLYPGLGAITGNYNLAIGSELKMKMKVLDKQETIFIQKEEYILGML